MSRQSVDRPLFTGLKVIDSMIPIGKGQRELLLETAKQEKQVLH